MKALKQKVTAIPIQIQRYCAFATVAVMMLLPQLAFGAPPQNAIDQAFGIVRNQVLTNIYRGLVGIVALTALIIIIVELLRGVFDPDGQKRTAWIKRAAIVLGICFVAAFAPVLVNWIIGEAGTGAVQTVPTNPQG